MSGPFGRSDGGGPRNSDSLFSQSDSRQGGEHGFSRSPLGRFKDDTIQANITEMDMRNNMEIPITALEARFPEEFANAEKRIKERKDSWKELFRTRLGGYDYENDQAYQAWLKDNEERIKVLKMHWLDDWLDRPRMQVQIGLRIFTTIGFVHGAYKARQLWSTIDKNYAKLHGVGLASIVADHVPKSIAKGGAVGVAWGLGIYFGDTFARVGECLINNTVDLPRRKWQHVFAGFFMGGVCGSAATVAVNFYTLRPFGHALVAGSVMVGTTAAGAYLGAVEYRKHQALDPEHNYKVTPRPWHEKEYQKMAPLGENGRWA
eukprot:CAMPEP_0174831584 /NCGR_PEP_ID=MMETSP1114-20130205/3177_1 /TAXON_ID=312471 /ORGANISM="Neobodo designis, Strain CCAP 1951/1" /LENGTH=317 /DNA_ID=CAMNT_0016065411 /DNA_START=50 /DNA_END=1003 /DNA_ORIENTATION=+